MKRSVVGMVVLWAVVVATMSAVVWVVIDRAGQAVVAGPPLAMPPTTQQAPASTTAPSATATSTTTAPTSPPVKDPTPTSTATIQPSSTPTRTRSFGTPGGTATVSCGSFGIRLDAASPADGFRPNVSDEGGSLDVTFVMSGPPEVEHELTVTCQGGVPTRADG